jgi:hypothetical protein
MPSSGRRHKPRPRDWLTLDLEYLAQDTIQDLGHEFGPAGPLVFLAILLAAKRAATAGLPPDKQGCVTLRYRAVARGTFVPDVDVVRRIVSASVRLGLLEAIDSEDADDEHFTVRLAKWSAWEPRDSNAAARMRRSRER